MLIQQLVHERLCLCIVSTIANRKRTETLLKGLPRFETQASVSARSRMFA